MEENKMNLESNDKQQLDSEEKVKTYRLAEKIITQLINKIMRDKPDLKDKEDIKMAVETEIVMPLMNQNLNEKVEKEIQSIMQVFDIVFDIAYKKCVEKKEQKEKEQKGKENDTQMMPLEEKARIFNELIRESMNKIPKEYLNKYLKEKKDEKQIQYTPLRNGKPVKQDINHTGMGER